MGQHTHGASVARDHGTNPEGPLHVVKAYARGIGHIDEREADTDRYLVSFYGRRVVQAWAPTLEAARGTLRRLAARHGR